MATIFPVTIQSPRTIYDLPKSRFVSLGPEDESWCRFFGIGQDRTVYDTWRAERAYVKAFTSEGDIELGFLDEPILCCNAPD